VVGVVDCKKDQRGGWGVTCPNTASRAPVCDALAGGRDYLRLFRSRSQDCSDSIDIRAAGYKSERSRGGCHFRNAVICINSYWRRCTAQAVRRRTKKQTPSITAGCSSGHIFSVEFLRSLILRPQVFHWNEKGQWSLRYAWLCRAGVGVESLRCPGAKLSQCRQGCERYFL
jgi:hypothetical protein